MTSVHVDIAECAVCRNDSWQRSLSSSNIGFGSYDLDLRPPGMLGDSMDYWLQECPHCRYVNEDITVLIPGASEIVKTRVYKSIVKRRGPYDLPGVFERYSMLLSHDPIRSSEALLNAAWICDDRRLRRRAQEYRRRSAATLAPVDFAPLGEQGLRLQVMLVDIWRRAKSYKEAGVLIMRLRTMTGLTPAMSLVIDFQETRVRDRDFARYTVEQADDYRKRSMTAHASGPQQ
jgi:hypothetical protein